METKICKQCKKEKNINDFYKKSDLKDGHFNKCKECCKKYYEKNKEQKKDYQHQYYLTNKEKIDLRKKEYVHKNEKQLKKKKKQYYLKNREKFLESSKERYSKNKNEINKKTNIHRRERKKIDNCYKLKEQIRNMIYKSFDRKGFIKSKKTEEIIGISHKEFYEYLLNTFKNNYGYEWDGKEKVSIDHIIPLAIANTEEEIIKLCHYKNLQLLKLKDNLEKSDKLNWKIKKGDKND